MEINFISYVPAILGIVSISVFVLLNAHNTRNRIFALLNLFIALWLFFLFLAGIPHNDTTALWLFRLALFFGQLMFLFFYYFALVFPYPTKTSVSRQLLYSMPMIVISLLLLTPLGVASVSVKSFGVQPDQIGFIYTFSDIIGIFYMLVGIGILLFKYKKSDIKQKSQIKFVLIGLTIALIVNIVTGDVLTLLNVNTDYIDAGPISLFIFSLFVAYAMIKHGFLDIRLIVARTMAYVLTLTSIAAIYSAIVFGVISRFIDLSQTTRSQQFIYVVVAVFLSFTFHPITQFFNKLSNKLFYRDAYDAQSFLDQFNKLLVSSFELKPLLRNSTQVIEENLKPAYCVFSLRGENHPGQIIGIPGHSKFTRADINLVGDIALETHQKLIVTDELEDKHKKLQDHLQANNIAVIAHLAASSTEEGVGYLILGPKKSGNLYSSQDLNIIEIISNELVIAVQNALRFEEIKNFNLTLQEKVDDATRKLRKANERLKAMDETKDDFISMASHQLRTPLTSIKGYISMVLEGDAGKVTHMEREMLGQAFFSSQRMVYLIADLLNISRLKTGRFVIEPAQVNLANVVDQELGQLEETAASRSVTLTYDKPKRFPDLMLDETKTRQVIMNFVDNAIYYTEAGGHIKVRLVDNPTTIELRVEDSGIGVPKSEQPHLFTKFYRAGNARKARPDGTGLGLFMAKKVIVAQGGSVIFESQEGKGSTFGFVFSKSKLATTEAEKAPPKETALAATK